MVIGATKATEYSCQLANAIFEFGTVGVQWGWMMAVITMLTVPVVILFFFTQRTFIQWISMTGIKG